MDPKLPFNPFARRVAKRLAPGGATGLGAVRQQRQGAGRWRCGALDRETGLRQRIACRLHDDLGQLLVLQGLKLATLRGLVGPEAALPVQELQGLVDRMAAATRAAVLELAEPAWPAALEPGLREAAAQVAAQAGVAVTVDVDLAGLALPAGHVATLCRIARELCVNVLKHALARELRIQARLRGPALCVSVSDDGVGMATDLGRMTPGLQGGFGLVSAQAQLRALGGRLRVFSRRGAGTCVSLLLPLPVRK